MTWRLQPHMRVVPKPSTRRSTLIWIREKYHLASDRPARADILAVAMAAAALIEGEVQWIYPDPTGGSRRGKPGFCRVTAGQDLTCGPLFDAPTTCFDPDRVNGY